MNVGTKVQHAKTGRSGVVAWVGFAWREPNPAPVKATPACVVCLEPNEYQDGPFTCGKCRHEASLRADEPPKTQPAPVAPAAATPASGAPLRTGDRVAHIRNQALRGLVGTVVAIRGHSAEVDWGGFFDIHAVDLLVRRP